MPPGLVNPEFADIRMFHYVLQPADVIPVGMRGDQQIDGGCFQKPGAIVSVQVIDYPRAIATMAPINNHDTLLAVQPEQLPEAQTDRISALAEALQGEEVNFVTRHQRTMETEKGFSRARTWAIPGGDESV